MKKIYTTPELAVKADLSRCQILERAKKLGLAPFVYAERRGRPYAFDLDAEELERLVGHSHWRKGRAKQAKPPRPTWATAPVAIQ